VVLCSVKIIQGKLCLSQFDVALPVLFVNGPQTVKTVCTLHTWIESVREFLRFSQCTLKPAHIICLQVCAPKQLHTISACVYTGLWAWGIFVNQVVNGANFLSYIEQRT